MLRISDVKLNDVPVVNSVVEVSRLIATFLNELSKYVYITYRHTMNSNHSQCRYLGTKANEMPSEDMEYIIGNYISDLVSKNKRIEVKLSLYDYDSFNLCGQNIITLHGHQIKNIKEVSEPLKEQILHGNIHTIDGMMAWLQPLGYSDAINNAAVNEILREFVMSNITPDLPMNMDMVVNLLRPQLEVTKEDIEPIIYMGLCHHRDLIGAPNAFIKNTTK